MGVQEVCGTKVEICRLRFPSQSLLVALNLAAPSPHAICIAASDFHRNYVAIFIAGCDFYSQTAIPIASLCDFHRKPFGFPSQASAISIASVCDFLRITDLPNWFPPPSAISSQACILCNNPSQTAICSQYIRTFAIPCSKPFFLKLARVALV